MNSRILISEELTFSPLSEGKQNVNTVRNEIPMQGIIMLTVNEENEKKKTEKSEIK